MFGHPNAEFDWCETNFKFSHLVAEPFNSGTSSEFCPQGAA
jgi:hypothetical protein